MDQLRRRLPTCGRKASTCLSRGISTAACHNALYPPPIKQMLDQPLSGWTDVDSARVGPLYLHLKQAITHGLSFVESTHYGGCTPRPGLMRGRLGAFGQCA